MDGITITQVLEENGEPYVEMQTADAYPFCTEIGDTIVENDEIPEEDIAQMIALNEGINQPSSPPPEILGSPNFKHIVKLTANTSHPSLKKRSYIKTASKTNKNKIDALDEWDDDEASRNPLDSSFLKKTKFDATAESIVVEKNIKTLKHEKKVIERKVLRLRKYYSKESKRLRQAFEKEKINIERKTKRLRQELQKKVLLLEKMCTLDGTKKRGRKLGSGQKLRHELGLDEMKENDVSDSNSDHVSGLVAETVAILKTRSGRSRKVKSGLDEYVLHSKAANFVYTGGLFAETPSSLTSTLDDSVLLSPVEVTPNDMPKKARGRPRRNPMGGIPKVLTDYPQPKEELDVDIESTSLQLDTSTIEEGICSEPNMKNDISLTQEKLVVGEERASISAESCLKSAPSECGVRRVSSRGVGLQRPITKSLENGVNVLAANATTNADFPTINVADGSNEHVDHENIPLNEPLTDNGVQNGNNLLGRTRSRSLRPTSQCSDADPPTEPLKEKDLNADASNDSNTAVAPGAYKKMRKELLVVLQPLVGPQSEDLKSPLKQTSSNMPSYSEKNETLVKSMLRSSIGVKKEKKINKLIVKQEIVDGPSENEVDTDVPEHSSLPISDNAILENNANLSLDTDEILPKVIPEIKEKRRSRSGKKKIDKETDSVSMIAPETVDPQVLDDSVRRRSGRAVRLTSKLANMIQTSRRQDVSSQEAYPNLINRGTSSFESLQVKVEALTSRFECTWSPGDLVWAKLGEFPYWPSIVIQDPFSGDEYSKVKTLAKVPKLFVHVQFLHQRGRRAWGPATLLIRFQGLSAFRALEASLPQTSPTKNTKVWTEAVKEGEVMLLKSEAERLALMRRRHPLERYGDWSMQDEKIADITDLAELTPSSVESPSLPTLTKVARSRKSRINYTKNGAPQPDILKTPILQEPATPGDNKELLSNEIKSESFLNKKKKRLANEMESPKLIKARKPIRKFLALAWIRWIQIPTVMVQISSDVQEAERQSEGLLIVTPLKDESSCASTDSLTGPSVNDRPVRNRKKRSKKSKMGPVEAVASTEASSVNNDRAGSVASDVSTHSSQSLEDISRNVKRAKNFMFKGVGNEKICELCLGVRNEATYQCSGVCLGYFHASCVEKEAGINSPSKKRQTLPENWQCSHCVRGQNPCFVCKESTGTRQMCLSVGCGKFYHHSCLKLFPQTKFNHGKRKNIGLQVDSATANIDNPPPLEIVACARHTCHTCCSDNPNQCAVLRLDKLMTCIKCATSYHSGNFCLPAGTEVLTTNSILCGKHFEPGQGKTTYHFNINWCFICTRGGSLICCDWCPSSIHAECLKLKPPEDSYACEECESGRFPLHGEVVWVKLGAFRWWPSKVLYPHETPRNMLNMRRRQCEFAVMFFGTMDYQWVNRGRVFLYNEGDAQNNFRVQKRLDKSFQRALLEAKEEFAKRKDALTHRSGSVKGKPAPYTKIRSNKYPGRRVTANGGQTERQVCECSPTDEEPCGALSNCLNRVLLIECHPARCPAGLLCCNQRFEKRQYPPLVTIRTDDRGWGLQSTVDLVKGQFIIEYVGEVITDEELAVRLKMKQDAKDCNYYFLRLDNSRVIDAGPMGNNARFMNHSCDPNCETQKWTVNGLTRIGLFACEDIPSGTELTFNYDMDCVGGKTACSCSASNCTGFIGEAAKVKKLEAEEIGKKKAKSKTRSKKADRRLAKMAETTCCQCGLGGELLVCAAAGCVRVMHVKCAGLPEWPNEDWLCSRHLCSICGHRTKRCCQECSIAYCARHTAGYIYTSESGELYCGQHICLAAKPDATRPSNYLKRRDAEESVSISNSDDLVPAMDLDLTETDQESPKVLWDQDGHEVHIQSDTLKDETDVSPKRKKRTNIPRSKIYQSEEINKAETGMLQHIEACVNQISAIFTSDNVA